MILKIKIFKRIITTFCILTFVSAVYSADTPNDEEIINKLILKYGAMYKLYNGIETRRIIIRHDIDPKTNKEVSVSEIELIKKEYFYKTAETTIVKCKKDGIIQPNESYKVYPEEPSVPLFDNNGRENYKFEVNGYCNINGINCLKIKIVPLKITQNHFSGYIYIDPKKTELIYIEGGVAKIPFPVKELSMFLYTRDFNNVPVMTSGVVNIRLSIPLVLPDSRMKTEIKVIEKKLI